MLDIPNKIAVIKRNIILKTEGIPFSIPKSKAKTTPFMPRRIPAFASAL